MSSVEKNGEPGQIYLRTDGTLSRRSLPLENATSKAVITGRKNRPRNKAVPAIFGINVNAGARIRLLPPIACDLATSGGVNGRL
jgi:hypothetical protein